ncbi:MAG: hypothetical protein GQF41_2214 [Candidatus Rifleibacterium amylolyticum]|nr:MAG: hypothetical protein GQF41_2214 [Candidatus Rifleibacterium amylolyticum]
MSQQFSIRIVITKSSSTSNLGVICHCDCEAQPKQEAISQTERLAQSWLYNSLKIAGSTCK